MTSEYSTLNDPIERKLEKYHGLLPFGIKEDSHNVKEYVKFIEQSAKICCAEGHDIRDDDELDRIFADMISQLTDYLRESKEPYAGISVYNLLYFLGDEIGHWVGIARHFGTVRLADHLKDSRTIHQGAMKIEYPDLSEFKAFDALGTCFADKVYEELVIANQDTDALLEYM